MISAGTSIGIFTGVTFIYFVAKYFFVDRNMTAPGTFSMILGVIYLITTIGIQIGINSSNASELCNGVTQKSTALIYTLAPNLLILGSVMMLLTLFPGWKSPFSNTVGYGLVYMMGVNNAFTDLLQSKGSKLIEKICEDKSILINEMTQMNFFSFLNRLSRDNIIIRNYQKAEATKSLWRYLAIKNSIAEFIWLFFAGALTILMTYNAIMDITCSYNSDDREEISKKFAEISKPKGKPKYYKK